MLLFVALACHAQPEDSPDPTEGGDDTGTTRVPYDCAGDGEAGPEVTESWAHTGSIPVQGLSTFGTLGDWPVYLASHSTGAWRSDSNQMDWRALNTRVSHTVAHLALNPADALEVYRNAGGPLDRSTDGGTEWTTTAFGSTDPTSPDYGYVLAAAVSPWDPARVYGVYHDGRSAISTDSGATITYTGDLEVTKATSGIYGFEGWRLLASSEPGARVIFANGDGVFVSGDEMETWTLAIDEGVVGSTLVRDPGDPDRVFVGEWLSEDGGATWTSVGPAGAMLAAWGEALVVMTMDGLYVSSDGLTFGDRLDVPGAGMHAHGSDATHDTLNPGALTAVAGMLLYADPAGGVWRSEDDGQSWTSVAAGVKDNDLSVVEAHPACPGRVIAGTRCSGGLFLSRDAGDTWALPDGHFHYVMEVVYDPSDYDRIYVLSDQYLFRSEDGGETFDTVGDLSYHFHGFAIDPRDPDVLLIGSVGEGEWADEVANVYRSEDRGETWEATTGIPASVSSAHQIRFVEGDVVLAGFYKGDGVAHGDGAGIGLYRSTDGGRSWSVVEDFAPVDVAGLEVAGGVVFAATGNGLWRSLDAGLSWERLLDGTVLSVAVVGDVGLAIAEDGKTWRTSDAGETWTEIYTLPGAVGADLAQVAVTADGLAGYLAYPGQAIQKISLAP
ncbi:MAG: hypothetical protein ACOZNI_07590 [Myxococcota bacterium]